MGRRLLIGLFVTVVLFILLYGCNDMTTQMSDSKKLYLSKCSSCHNVIAPGSYDEEKWRLHIEKYGKKMTDEEKQTLLSYLVKSD